MGDVTPTQVHLGDIEARSHTSGIPMRTRFRTYVWSEAVTRMTHAHTQATVWNIPARRICRLQKPQDEGVMVIVEELS